MGVGKGDARMVVHGTCHGTAGGAQLLQRLVIGCGIGEALAVEHVICVEEERTHAQRVLGAPFQLVGIVLALPAYLWLA